jgi:uncharacterized protein YejL (UPF0352 family)
MESRNTIDQVFRRLVAAPNGIDCRTDEVLAACGRFVTALLNVSFPDPADRRDVANKFRKILQRCVTPHHDTRLH